SACGFFFRTRYLTRIRSSAISAVSDPEKKPDNRNKTARAPKRHHSSCSIHLSEKGVTEARIRALRHPQHFINIDADPTEVVLHEYYPKQRDMTITVINQARTAML